MFVVVAQKKKNQPWNWWVVSQPGPNVLRVLETDFGRDESAKGSTVLFRVVEESRQL